MHKELPVRKIIRLQGYDYSQNGAYYVTMCVENRHEILGQIVGSGFHARPCENPMQPLVELTDIGIEIQKTIDYICNNDQRIEIPKYVIMPNHVHLIILLKTVGHDHDASTVGHGSPTLQSVVGRIKSYTAKRWSEICGEKYQTFWQYCFHDHIIRSKEEYWQKWLYIDENPAKWAEDRYYRQ